MKQRGNMNLAELSLAEFLNKTGTLVGFRENAPGAAGIGYFAEQDGELFYPVMKDTARGLGCSYLPVKFAVCNGEWAQRVNGKWEKCARPAAAAGDYDYDKYKRTLNDFNLEELKSQMYESAERLMKEIGNIEACWEERWNVVFETEPDTRCSSWRCLPPAYWETYGKVSVSGNTGYISARVDQIILRDWEEILPKKEEIKKVVANYLAAENEWLAAARAVKACGGKYIDERMVKLRNSPKYYDHFFTDEFAGKLSLLANIAVSDENKIYLNWEQTRAIQIGGVTWSPIGANAVKREV